MVGTVSVIEKVQGLIPPWYNTGRKFESAILKIKIIINYGVREKYNQDIFFGGVTWREPRPQIGSADTPSWSI